MGRSVIRDMIYVNQLEKRLGRRLTAEEVEIEEYEGVVEIRFPDKHREFISIPRLVFPDELLSIPDAVLEEFNENRETLQPTVQTSLRAS